jgi:PKD repeat protein
LYENTGTYTVSLNVSGIGGMNATTKTNYITVISSGGFVQQDIWMAGNFFHTFHITDSETGLEIPIVTLTDSSGQNFTTTNGTGWLTEYAGTIWVRFSADGYDSKTITYYIDGNGEHEVQLVPVTPSTVPNANTVYIPRLVRLRAVDNWRTPLTPVTITANYISDTLPNNDPVYLQNAFGVSESVVSLMMNSSVAMSGVTGSDGSNTFSMFPALTYNLTVTNETMGVHCQQDLAPADTDYVLFCPTDAQKAVVVPLSQTLNRSYIWVTEPNASFVTINASYQDPTGLTSNVLFNVSVVDNNTVIYSKNFENPGTSQVLDNYTMPNIRGMQIKSYLAYNRSAS